MSRFIIWFMKDVLGENGREVEICQSTVEVDAANKTPRQKLPSKNSAKPKAFPSGQITLIE